MVSQFCLNVEMLPLSLVGQKCEGEVVPVLN